MAFKAETTDKMLSNWNMAGFPVMHPTPPSPLPHQHGAVTAAIGFVTAANCRQTYMSLLGLAPAATAAMASSAPAWVQ